MRWLAPGLATMLALGCSRHGSDEHTPGAGGAGEGAGCEGRGVELAVGHELATASAVMVQVASLSPAVPIVGDNSWRLQLTRDGEPVNGASLNVLPWMPDHQHASTKVVRVEQGAPGHYELHPVYLGMPGYWEVGVDITLDDEALGSVSLNVCLGEE